VPCFDFAEYISQTFPPHVALPESYRSSFRIVAGGEYLDSFASDRSHMLRVPPANGEAAKDGSGGGQAVYCSAPPLYAPLCGPKAKARGVTHNLMASFVDMSAGGGESDAIGKVYTLEEAMKWG